MNINQLTRMLVEESANIAEDTWSSSVELDHFIAAITRSALVNQHFTRRGDDQAANVYTLFNEHVDKILDAMTKNSDYDDEDEYYDDVDTDNLPTSKDIAALVSLAQSAVVGADRNSENMDAVDLLTAVVKNTNTFSNSYICKFLGVEDELRTSLEKVLSSEVNTNTQSSADDVSDYLLNLSEDAKAGKIEPVIGRAKEIHQITETLARKRKPNVMMLGKAGTGKTAIIEGIALAIESGDVHESLEGFTVYSLDIAAMLAGTKFRGEFEERAKKVFDYLLEQDKAILFIDEFHTAIGAGGTSESKADLSNFMKPHLARGGFRCICATTDDEYRSSVEKNKALIRRFTNIEIKETDKESTIEIMNGVRQSFEDFHNLKFEDHTIELMYDLADKYIQNRHFPDKAIDMLDETIAVARVNDLPTVNEDTVYKVVSKITGVAVSTMKTTEESDMYKDLNKNLKAAVFGQDHIADIITKQVMLSKAGLNDDNKPMGCFLFSGSSGTGKTEISRALAKSLDMKLVKFDMSEYMEKHSVSKLIGAPAGYAGYDENTAGLVDAIERDPNCVLLFDEVEKAHPQVLDILLQVMDDARLTSSQGKTVSFKNVILIMTSNLGASAASNTSSMGFKGSSTGIVSGAINKHFRPEFINRLNAVATFNNLTADVVSKIVVKELDILRTKIESQGYSVTYSSTVINKISKDAYDPKMGARPIKRYIADNIKQAIAEKMVMDAPKEGKCFAVKVSGGEIVVEVV